MLAILILLQLLSLKAELLRKQEEVSKAKRQQNLNSTNDFVPRRTNIGATKKSKKTKTTESIEAPKDDENNREECAEMLAKSKRVLEAKAKLYDRLTASGGGATNSDETSLVLFNKKKQNDRPYAISSSSSNRDSDSDRSQRDDDDDDTDADELWTEYTDCLGRTRKCLKSDLAHFKQKDVELAGGRSKNSEANRVAEDSNASANRQPWFVDTKGMSSDDLPFDRPLPSAVDQDDTLSMISKASKMEEMRVQWEHKEQENMNRDEIHYQDVLFDEARTHGVGYYAFSADQIERAKQQQELEIERERTLEAQRKRDKQRQLREKIIADRVFGAKNRQRARLGLPPLERDVIVDSGETVDDSDVAKEAKRRLRKEEKERKKKERDEQRRAEERKQHLRPWDDGKNDAAKRKPFSDSDDETKEWEYKPEKPEPMSQEQWNNMKRAERVEEFAPFDEPEPIRLNRFTTIQPKAFKRRNADIAPKTSNTYNEPIRNELDATECPDPVDDESDKRRRAEFAPPPTFEYYGPASATSRPRSKPTTTTKDLETAVEAGLRFLREQSDKSATGTKQKWVSNADY